MRYPKYMAKRRNIQKQLLRFLKIIKEQKKQIYHKQNAILQHKQIKKNIYMFQIKVKKLLKNIKTH